MSNYRSLSPTYYDPEAEPVPEPEPEPIVEAAPEPKKRRGRAPGTPNKPKPKRKKNIPWFNILRGLFWTSTLVFVIVMLFLGVRDWLGLSAAYIVLSVATLVAAIVLDRGWRKMGKPNG
jgi:hypothetical protein